jgi:tRNA threonylcarbamoyladenosine biosynthesis protein TsaB
VITLALDASTYVGTVAVLRDGIVLAAEATAMRGHDVERLMPAVPVALASAGVARGDIKRVVCGAGPGSFTSLRIAASIAKGLAMGAGCGLYAVPSLALMVAGTPSLGPGLYLAVLDALRGEAYAAAYERDPDGRVAAVDVPRLVASADVAALAAQLGARVVGPGHELDAAPHARGLAGAEGLVEPVDVGSWEPTYGRLAEAQVKWEAAHGRPLSAS